MSEQLQELKLEGDWLVERGLSALTSLTSLFLSGCHIWAGDRYALLALTQLKTLDLSGTHLMDQYGGEAIGYWSDTKFLTAMSTSLVQLTRLNLNQVSWVKDDNFSALGALPHLREVEAGGLHIPATRLRHDFTGVPLVSFGIAVWDQEELEELKAWLEQAAPGSQLSPLSCLRILDLSWLRLPTASLGMESWASKLVQLTELVIRPESEGEVRQAFGARFSHQQDNSGAFVLRPLGGP